MATAGTQIPGYGDLNSGELSEKSAKTQNRHARMDRVERGLKMTLDRFSCGFTPQVVEVGYCQACDSIIYDYEKSRCDSCEDIIHDRCKSACQSCGMPGCGKCIKLDDEGYELCEECRANKSKVSHK